MEDVVVRLKELTDVDFERDSAKRENEFSLVLAQSWPWGNNA